MKRLALLLAAVAVVNLSVSAWGLRTARRTPEPELPKDPVSLARDLRGRADGYALSVLRGFHKQMTAMAERDGQWRDIVEALGVVGLGAGVLLLVTAGLLALRSGAPRPG